jgi:predicted RNase H-like HicB family nuclease
MGRLHIDFDREEDGRWIAEIPELPGVLAYGPTRESARDAVVALGLRVLADRIEHNEPVPAPLNGLFEFTEAA